LYAPEEMNYKEALNTQEPGAMFEFLRHDRLASGVLQYAPKESGQIKVPCKR